MSQTKYITSGGLAFSEGKDMKKLRQYSLKGWHVRDFAFLGYTLERGESTDYIYSIDYRWLEEEEEEEYFDFFSSSGWSHVVSEGDIHLFRALPGTKPIYTDRETTVEKHENSFNSIKNLVIPVILITALAWLGVMLSSSTLESILRVVAIILSGITVAIAMTTFATNNNKWEAEGRRGSVKLVKSIPVILVLIGVITLLSIVGAGTTIKFLSGMIIAGIAVPTVIWVIMSLYHKVGGKER